MWEANVYDYLQSTGTHFPCGGNFSKFYGSPACTTPTLKGQGVDFAASRVNLYFVVLSLEKPPSPDWTKYDEVEARSPNTIQLSHTGKGYSLLGPAEGPNTGSPPALTPQNIQDGYALLGDPTQEAGTSSKCPLRPDSTYAEVRQEGDSLKPIRDAAPPPAAFDDYSRLGFPTAGVESEPLPISGTSNP